MSLVKTDAGIFDPKAIKLMTNVREKKEEAGTFYFSIILDGISETLWFKGTEQKMRDLWNSICKAMFEK